MVYYRFCATGDGFVGFCGLLVVVVVEVSVAGWWVWWWQRLVEEKEERERKRENRDWKSELNVHDNTRMAGERRSDRWIRMSCFHSHPLVDVSTVRSRKPG